MSSSSSSVMYINDTVLLEGPAGWIYRYPVEIHSFPFENADFFWWQSLPVNNWEWALYAGAVYIVTILGLQRWMKDKPAMKLKLPLFSWNLFLGVFSILGFSRTAPGLLRTLKEPNGLYSSICTRTGMDIPTGFWTILFVLSKPLEFGDTVFTVLRKRPLVFLQWYHHLATMCVSWILAPPLEPITRWYMILNFGVHSLMYPYFALKTIGYKIPKIFADIITTVEVSQMAIGLMINITSVYYKHIGEDCARTDLSIRTFSVLYGSFLLLFGKLFYDSVIKTCSSPEGSKRDSENAGGILLMSSCDEGYMSLEKMEKLE